MEKLEIVCERTGNPTGVYLDRHEAIARGAWCRSTNVFVLNSQGQVLCHQRSMQKERMPGVWSTHLGGHVSMHETFETNAVKEVEEEAGVSVAHEQLFAWRTTKLPHARLWVREFVTLHDAPIEQLVPQPGEVDQFAWKNPQDILTESRAMPHAWCAGTCDFQLEYHCMMAVLTAAHSMGKLSQLVSPSLFVGA